jgi:hypothetical protein
MEEKDMAGALRSIAFQLKEVGEGDLCAPEGAVAMVAKEIRDGFKTLSTAIETLSYSVDDLWVLMERDNKIRRCHVYSVGVVGG